MAVNHPECKLKGAIQGLQLLEVVDVADETPGWARPVVSRLVSTPVILRQDAEADWHLQMPGIDARFPTRGIFEFCHVE